MLSAHNADHIYKPICVGTFLCHCGIVGNGEPINALCAVADGTMQYQTIVLRIWDIPHFHDHSGSADVQGIAPAFNMNT